MARTRGAPARSAPAPARAAPARAAPAPQAAAPAAPPAQHAPQVSQGPGLMGTLAQGMAFGAGSEVAHQAVRSFMGGGSSSHAPAQEAPAPAAAAPSAPASLSQGGACAIPQKDLYACLQQSNGNAGACQYYFDALKSCNEAQQFA